MTWHTLAEQYKWPSEKPSVPPDGHCWCAKEHKANFPLLAPKIGTILEIGSWTGAGSTRWFLENTECQVIAIDTWQGSIEHLGNTKLARRVASKIPTLYETFCVNLWNYKNRLIPMRENSRNALPKVFEHQIIPNLIYVDGSHEEEDVFMDISLSIRLFPEAKICGDDYRWPGVNHALSRIKIMYLKEIKAGKDFWSLE